MTLHNADRFDMFPVICSQRSKDQVATMDWFRLNRGIATWAAFFALACQLAFSFGHVHVGNFSGGSAAWADTGDVPLRSPEKNPAGLAGDFCAVCANISLAGTIVFPILAILLLPVFFIKTLHWSFAARKSAPFDHLPFSARGPPRF
jgi:hypothetical protein